MRERSSIDRIVRLPDGTASASLKLALTRLATIVFLLRSEFVNLGCVVASWGSHSIAPLMSGRQGDRWAVLARDAIAQLSMLS
jgi:hypothetical protein